MKRVVELERYPRWFGHYLLLDSIGAGGFGLVHLAARAGEDELLVLKTLRPELLETEEPRARFQHEVKLCARLDGPCFVRLLEAGAVRGTPYLAMEYVEGCSLRGLFRRLKEQKSVLARHDAAEIARGVLASVAALHEVRDEDGARLGIVHRDLSPSNLMVGEDRKVRLIDLGVGRSELGVFETRTGQVMGSLGYMSPEQVRAKNVSQASDQFACAMILWELFSGDRLISAAQPAVVLMRTARLKYPPLRKRHPRLPEALDQALRRALERAPEARFESVAAFARALEPVWAELPEDEAGTLDFAEAFSAQRAPDALEALREVARAAEPPPAEQPTIFATMMRSPDKPEGELTLAVTSFEVLGLSDTPLPAPRPERPASMTLAPPPRRAAWWSRLGGALFAVAMIAASLAVGLKLAQPPVTRVQLAAPGPPIDPPLISPKAGVVPRAAEPDAPRAPEPERAGLKPPPRRDPIEPPRREPEIKVEPAPESPPDLEALVRRAGSLRDHRPELASELDALLGDLALEGRRKDPARLKHIEGRLRALESR